MARIGSSFALALVLSVAVAALAATRADDSSPRSAVASLEDRLKSGLRVQAPQDADFCDRVVRLVRDGDLPAQVVDSTYLWAVRRGKQYPFPAFKFALQAKAAKLGVRL